MTVHHLEPTMQTLHGVFSSQLEPVLHINSGDSITANTLDAGWSIAAPPLDGSPRQRHPAFDEQPQRGHAMHGPVYINGAEAGMTLVMHIDELVPGEYGWSYSGGFEHRVNAALGIEDGDETLTLWSLDADTMTGINQHGQTIRLAPFLGNLGMPPPDGKNHSTAPPRQWGGNLDCKDLVVGTRLYLPVPVEGGLFSFGDGHAAQGHGEVSVTAIECPMDTVRLTLDLVDDFALPTPTMWTPDGWLTFGFDEDLEEATYAALDAMLTLMQHEYDIPSKQQALGLATALVDLHITQIANPVMGVHAFLPHDALLES